nr:MAG TPA: hypothetical protein [Caudoviricetes sp.]
MTKLDSLMSYLGLVFSSLQMIKNLFAFVNYL